MTFSSLRLRSSLPQDRGRLQVHMCTVESVKVCVGALCLHLLFPGHMSTRHYHILSEREILLERLIFYSTPYALLGHRAEIPLHLCYVRRKRSRQHVSFCRWLCGLPPPCLAVDRRQGSQSCDRPHCINQLLFEFRLCGHVILNVQKFRRRCRTSSPSCRCATASKFHLRSRSPPSTSPLPLSCVLPPSAAAALLLVFHSAAAALVLRNCCLAYNYRVSDMVREHSSSISFALRFPSASRTPCGTISSLTTLARPASCEVNAARTLLHLPLCHLCSFLCY